MTSVKVPLRRPRSGRMIAGVVAGLAQYFGLDPTLARVGYVIASIVSAAFPGILVYALLWAIIPEGDENRRVELPPNKRLEPTPPLFSGRMVFVNTRAVRRGSAAGR